jgi:hypothetical protein
MDAVGLIDRYCEVWNTESAGERAELLDAVWAPGASYTDPSVHAASAAELLAHIAKVRAGRPGARIVRTSDLDSHHGMCRFGWRVVEADGTERPEGIDIVFFHADGSRIERIIGFFGPLTPASG